jgi:hypothetical protein
MVKGRVEKPRMLPAPSHEAKPQATDCTSAGMNGKSERACGLRRFAIKVISL